VAADASRFHRQPNKLVQSLEAASKGVDAHHWSRILLLTFSATSGGTLCIPCASRACCADRVRGRGFPLGNNRVNHFKSVSHPVPIQRGRLPRYRLRTGLPTSALSRSCLSPGCPSPTRFYPSLKQALSRDRRGPRVRCAVRQIRQAVRRLSLRAKLHHAKAHAARSGLSLRSRIFNN
jgi:hypothetical protein